MCTNNLVVHWKSLYWSIRMRHIIRSYRPKIKDLGWYVLKTLHNKLDHMHIFLPPHLMNWCDPTWGTQKALYIIFKFIPFNNCIISYRIISILFDFMPFQWLINQNLVVNCNLIWSTKSCNAMVWVNNPIHSYSCL